MNKSNYTLAIFYSCLLLLIVGCKTSSHTLNTINTFQPQSVLNYLGTPTSPKDRNSLAFSDQGAWFAYAFPIDKNYYGGFSGPFLMTQENGVWASPALSQLSLQKLENQMLIDLSSFEISQKSYNSHLEQSYTNEYLSIIQTLFFTSPHTALISTEIKNISNTNIQLKAHWKGKTFVQNLHLQKEAQAIKITSDKSDAIGYIQTIGEQATEVQLSDSTYTIQLENIDLKPKTSKLLLLTQSFIFSEYDTALEQMNIKKLSSHSQTKLQDRIFEKKNILQKLNKKLDVNWQTDEYKNLVAKTVLTLQNNWRIPSGELQHSGLFPSYHYVWFHGFWAWDSWKHAVALAHIDTDLAKEQIRAMYDFKDDEGFIADCVYRDATIEAHNYRNTKPPLSAWAVWKVYEQDKDVDFLKEMYPQILQQHRWWYKNRDHDQDGLCEYGSTDGTLIAAKWESGMDNAVRFDDSQILKNSDTAYSLNQESVDLNAYLYAEKLYLAEITKAMGEKGNAVLFESEAKSLKIKVQEQFFDKETGWFYDTSINGDTLIKVMGCEGWLPLWANVATPQQAQAVKKNMMNANYFFTKVPFQTLSAAHPKFKPDGGYWRGPNWLDQAYFGVKGLQNYGYEKDATLAIRRLIHNADGVLANGKSIRENYQPITGEGLESESFSWSAAHYLLLLLNE